MKSRWIIAFSIIVVPFYTATAGDIEYKKGETWTFEVKGPRPWTDENVYGDRVITVQRSDESGSFVKEMWGTYDDQPYYFTVKKDGLLSRLEVGSIILDYSKPVPFHYLNLLKVNEEKDFGMYERETDNWTLSLSTQIERGQDEDLTVPAGKFKGCQKYTLHQVLVFAGDQGERSREMTRQIWVHPDVNGMVKEQLNFQALSPDAGDGKLESVSTLKKHEVKK